MSEPQQSAAPFAAASVCACALGVALAFLAKDRGAAVWGAGSAAAGGLLAFAALAVYARRGTQGLLLGFSLGFLARGVAVGAGLIFSGARGNAALVYVLAFFLLYAATQTIEVLFVARRPGAAS